MAEPAGGPLAGSAAGPTPAATPGPTPPLTGLIARHARPGRVAWIGLRPARREAMQAVDAARLEATGLAGDRHARANGRAVTLIQWEHLPVIAALAGRESAPPALLRRNLSVAGLNLWALRKARLRVGAALVEITGPCAPCSRMEEALGHGGYTAMRGHGGWYARVIASGPIALGDPVTPEPAAAPEAPTD